jgi:phosphate/sulfate permease
VSTTHTLTGAIVGVGATHSLSTANHCVTYVAAKRVGIQVVRALNCVGSRKWMAFYTESRFCVGF